MRQESHDDDHSAVISVNDLYLYQGLAKVRENRSSATANESRPESHGAFLKCSESGAQVFLSHMSVMRCSIEGGILVTGSLVRSPFSGKFSELKWTPATTCKGLP
jgi:hypothetical protein